jgi:NAD(P)H-hydrate epimerase
VEVADISIPNSAVNRQNPDLFLLTESNLPKLKKRKPNSHKGTYGHAVIIGGAVGKSGAVIMASKACLKAGAGLVTAVIPEKINFSFEANFLEAMSFPTGKDYLTIDCVEETLEFIDDKTVLAIGPGIGRNKETAKFINKLLKSTDKKTVIDADGINALKTDTLKKLKNRAVLTPHLGEFARLLNISIEDVKKDRLELLKKFSVEFQVFTVLKSADTLIGTPDGKIFICNFGNPSLAKGGSGDCLTGLITGFLSQGYDFESSCQLGVFLLGKTAEIISKENNIHTVLTTEIINNLWKAFDVITEEQL